MHIFANLISLGIAFHLSNTLTLKKFNLVSKFDLGFNKLSGPDFCAMFDSAGGYHLEPFSHLHALVSTHYLE
jgi:hypothetical protein